MTPIRLDKLLTRTGELSRKEAKQRIRDGRVAVNGSPARSGDEKVLPSDQVLLDGREIRNQPHLYIMLNKPGGVVCATRDNLSPTVLELLPASLRRKDLFPAGRLDKDTEGFALITDDGDFAHRMLSPKRHVPKIYEASLDAPFDFAAVRDAFAQGLTLDGGDRCSPARLSLLEDGPAPRVRLTIYEGMYHQVKRMFRRFSVNVTHLRRIQIGGLPLDPELAPGEAKEIVHKDALRIFEDLPTDSG